MVGERADTATIARLRPSCTSMILSRPVGRTVAVMHGDLGASYITQRPSRRTWLRASQDGPARAPPWRRRAVRITLGVLSAIRPGESSTASPCSVVSWPYHPCIGGLLHPSCSRCAALAPAVGSGGLAYLVLPALTSHALHRVPGTHDRAAMRTCCPATRPHRPAKGERRVLRHAFRNALIP